MVGDINITPVFKLMKKGDIANAYLKMYHIADKLAKYDTSKHLHSRFQDPISSIMNMPKILVYEENYRVKRVEYHTKKMKELLGLRIKHEQKEK